MTDARDALVRALAEPVTVSAYRSGKAVGRSRLTGTLTDPGALADRLLTALADDEATARAAAMTATAAVTASRTPVPRSPSSVRMERRRDAPAH